MTATEDSAEASGDAAERELGTERTTAPQSEFTIADVTVGLLILVLGLFIAYGLPTILV